MERRMEMEKRPGGSFDCVGITSLLAEKESE